MGAKPTGRAFGGLGKKKPKVSNPLRTLDLPTCRIRSEIRSKRLQEPAAAPKALGRLRKGAELQLAAAHRHLALARSRSLPLAQRLPRPPHWLSGWPKKSPNFICTTKMVFPKSLKFMNSGRVSLPTSNSSPPALDRFKTRRGVLNEQAGRLFKPFRRAPTNGNHLRNRRTSDMLEENPAPGFWRVGPVPMDENMTMKNALQMSPWLNTISLKVRQTLTNGPGNARFSPFWDFDARSKFFTRPGVFTGRLGTRPLMCL